MANGKTVYTVEHLTLQDGTTITVKPLTIKRGREAQRLVNKIVAPEQLKDENGEPLKDENGDPVLDSVDSEDEANRIFLDLVLITLRGQENCAKYFEVTINDAGEREEVGRDRLEDALDMPTMMEIIKLSTGYDFLAIFQRTEQMLAGEK